MEGNWVEDAKVCQILLCFCSTMQYHLEGICLATTSIFQYGNDTKHTANAEKHTIELYLSWISLTRARSSALLKQCAIILLGREHPTSKEQL